MHKSYTICSETGKLAGATCPTINVVLAVNSDGTIKGKPSKVPEGKLDINISATCDSAHVMIPTAQTPAQQTPAMDRTLRITSGIMRTSGFNK